MSTVYFRTVSSEEAMDRDRLAGGMASIWLDAARQNKQGWKGDVGSVTASSNRMANRNKQAQ